MKTRLPSTSKNAGVSFLKSLHKTSKARSSSITSSALLDKVHKTYTSAKNTHRTSVSKDWELDCIYANFPTKMDVRQYCKLMHDFDILIQEGFPYQANRILHYNDAYILEFIYHDMQRQAKFKACYDKLTFLLADFITAMDETNHNLKLVVDTFAEQIILQTNARLKKIQNLEHIYAPMKPSFKKLIQEIKNDKNLLHKLTNFNVSPHDPCVKFKSTFTDMNEYTERVRQFEESKRGDPLFTHQFKDYFKKENDVRKRESKSNSG